MSSPVNPAIVSRSPRVSVPAVIAVCLWAALFVGIFIRTTRVPHKNTVVTTYLEAGTHWVRGESLYEGQRGFVYSPPTAAAFAALALLPPGLANGAWRLLNAAVFLGGIALWLRRGFFSVSPRNGPLVFILLLPLAIGNFNNGQVNPLVIGLLMIGVAAAERDRLWLAAFCMAAVAYLKIYPLAVGLLLAVLYPRRFSWRLLVALVGVGALAFALQRPAYVLEQYRLWLATRAADNRLEYAAEIMPRDFWLLLRLVHADIGQNAYRALQLLTGGGLAAVCAYGQWKGWSSVLLGRVVLVFGCLWMLLFGPATESATYILLAPVLALALVEAHERSLPASLRAMVIAVYTLFVLGLAANSFLHLKKGPATMCVQPAAAVLFVAYSVLELRWRIMRSDGRDGTPCRPSGKRSYGNSRR